MRERYQTIPKRRGLFESVSFHIPYMFCLVSHLSTQKLDNLERKNRQRKKVRRKIRNKNVIDNK